MANLGRGPDRPGVDDPGRGRRIGIDVGSVRIGIASSDPDGVLATPVETVPRSKIKGPDAPDVVRVAEIVAEYEAVEIVIGLPRTLRGERGSAVDAAERFGRSLHRRLGDVPIRMADERLTTVSASRALRDSGVRAKNQRSVIDQAAAVAILQGWLDERRAVSTRGAADRAVSDDAVSDHAGTNSGSTEVDE
ncbi:MULTISPECIES: Holliday junction resolvase RuvX [Nocardiaceae]|uniref:Holliday junction resolvase RuvX n=1 Tax=Nocardiaceae TaxID=85025 RepID=UPI00050C8104|nr:MULTISPECIES: Holliday junction resolvase RuvX [Rhodococcus]OZC43976.1 Holliday junction resolvase RuvX [Rhodococcus sp. WWJCD1]QII06388.1 Holliday junction resolvase RuvX [Rhodococcus fascians A25f]